MNAPPGSSLTDEALRQIVVALAPLAEIDSIAGLRARYRDPSEHPGTGGDQRDAAAALDAASDAGRLAAARVAYARFLRLSPDAQRTAWWLALRGGAVRGGALVSVGEWAAVYGRLDGPRLVAERAERLAILSSAADTKLRGLKHATRHGLTAELAATIDKASTEEAQTRAAMISAQAGLRAWAMGRFESLWGEWERL
jgi:hypothetical protein